MTIITRHTWLGTMLRHRCLHQCELAGVEPPSADVMVECFGGCPIVVFEDGPAEIAEPENQGHHHFGELWWLLGRLWLDNGEPVPSATEQNRGKVGQ